MDFINRDIERGYFKKLYEENKKKNISQVYVIEANHGIGKSEFIKEITKSFSKYPLDILQTNYNEELSAFKKMILEIDKVSFEYGYDDFKTFYTKNQK